MSFDYTRITPAIVARIVEEGITTCDRIVEDMLACSAPPSFATVMLPIEEIERVLNETSSRTVFLGDVFGDPDIQAAARDADERIGQWVVSFTENERVNELVLAVPSDTLNVAQARLLADRVHDIKMSGYGAPPVVRDEIGALRRRLIELESGFEQNIAAPVEESATIDELAGLPESFVAQLEVDEAGLRVLPITGPTVSLVMEQSPVRTLRERVYRAWLSRAQATNLPLLRETLAVRHRIAELLGYPSWAHLRIERQMAGTPERVLEFYGGLLPGLLRLGRAEMEQLADLAEPEIGSRVLQTWDVGYYLNRLRERDYQVDPETVASYFELDDVLHGFFDLFGPLFGIRFTPVEAVGAWHPDVRRWAIDDEDGTHLGIVDADLFPRPGKFTHAAAQALQLTYRAADGTRVPVHSVIMANLPEPTDERPSLLYFEQVKTLFHELGHVLHYVLSQATYISQSGTQVARDFVEAPSQIMENFLREPNVLRQFARHYQTREPIPESLVRDLVVSEDFGQGLFNLRQVYLGMLDQVLHGRQVITDIDACQRSLWPITLRAYPDGTAESASFGHLLGGYDATYYGYLWSLVHGDDMWSRFVEARFSPNIGRAYRRTILEPGGARDAVELLRAFLGREPSSASFLHIHGLADQDDVVPLAA